MVSMFGVNADAASFQQRYQQLVETILREFVDKQTQGECQNYQKPEIRLTDDNRVVYGEVNGKFRNDITPEMAEELEQLLSNPAGTIVEGATAKTLEVDGQIVFRSDENGKVITNSLIQEQQSHYQESSTTETLSHLIDEREPLAQFFHAEFDEEFAPPEIVAIDDSTIISEDLEDVEDLKVDNQEVNNQGQETIGFYDNVWIPEPLELESLENNGAFEINDAWLNDSWLDNSWTDVSNLNANQIENSQENLLSNFLAALNKDDFYAMSSAVAPLSKDDKVEIFAQLSEDERLKAMSVALSAQAFDKAQIGTQITEPEREPTLSENNIYSPIPIASESTSTKPQNAFTRVQAEVEKLPEPLKKYLTAQTEEMQQAKANQQQENLPPALQHIIDKRKEQPQSTSWWQQVKVAATEAFKSVRQRFQEYTQAAAIKNLFDAKSPDGNTYQTENYTIKRQGNGYNLLNKRENPLLMFSSNPVGVLVVDRQNINTNEAQKHDLHLLSVQQSKGEEPTGAFAPTGTRETEHLARVNAITQALTQYANQMGRTVQVDGQFSYKWTASPNGSVKIEAKDDRAKEGNGLLLIQGRKGMHSQMSDRDLAHFEKMMPILLQKASTKDALSQESTAVKNYINKHQNSVER